MQERAKLWLRPALGPLRSVFDTLRALPWPRSLQQLRSRDLSRLAARIPELAQWLGLSAPRPRAQRPTVDAVSVETLQLELAARDFRTRLKAVQALAHHPGELGEQALRSALRDRSAEVAVDAVHALLSSAGSAARATLREVLDNPVGYYHPLVRAAAVHALGKLPEAPETARIRQALYDSDAEVSIAAIAALSTSAPDTAREALLRLLDHGDGFFLPVTRLAAARGLQRVGELSPARLEAFAARERDPAVREILTQLTQALPVPCQA
jgi:HEAT repeat protein